MSINDLIQFGIMFFTLVSCVIILIFNIHTLKILQGSVIKPSIYPRLNDQNQVEEESCDNNCIKNKINIEVINITKTPIVNMFAEYCITDQQESHANISECFSYFIEYIQPQGKIIVPINIIYNQLSSKKYSMAQILSRINQANKTFVIAKIDFYYYFMNTLGWCFLQKSCYYLYTSNSICHLYPISVCPPLIINKHTYNLQRSKNYSHLTKRDWFEDTSFE